jgi:serpin B
MRRACCLLIVATALAACGPALPRAALVTVPGAVEGAPERDRPTASEDEVARVAHAMTAFGLDLFRRVREERGETVLVSPYSVFVALSMVHAGAEGDTDAAMAEALRLELPRGRVQQALNQIGLALLERAEHDGIELATANQLWGQDGVTFEQAYVETLGRHYGAPMARLDFSTGDAEDVVNDWVAAQTRDRIPELFAPGSFDARTRLVLANALYLDADWQRPFDPEQTRIEPFRRADGTSVDVAMMHNDRELPSGFGDDWTAVELPYAGDELAMVAIVADDPDGFERRLTPQLLDDVFARMTDGGIHLAFPKFETSVHTSLLDSLIDLGVPASGDFSGMTQEVDLHIEAVEHEVYVKVDEEGTEAAAATGVEMAESHGPTVTVDRPFFVVLRDRPTGAVLFLGRIDDPTSSR